MDLRDPPIDFVSLARGFGLDACCVTGFHDIECTGCAAIASGAPKLIECLVDDGFGNASG